MGKTKETQKLFCNQYGQIECHGCGSYSDIIYPVHQHNCNGAWVSMLCGHCRNKPRRPGCYIDQIDDPVDKKTYCGPIENL